MLYGCVCFVVTSANLGPRHKEGIREGRSFFSAPSELAVTRPNSKCCVIYHCDIGYCVVFDCGIDYCIVFNCGTVSSLKIWHIKK